MPDTATAVAPATPQATATTTPPAPAPAAPSPAPAAATPPTPPAPPAAPAAGTGAPAAQATKIELKLPEGSPLEPGDVERIAADAAKRGLSKDDAQALLERESSVAATVLARQQAQLAGVGAKWVEEIKADPELGGQKFDSNVEAARRFVDRFGDDSLKRALETTGLGNHPGFFKLCVKAGKASKEDTLVTSGLRGMPTKKDPAALLYPTHTQPQT